MRVIVLCLTLLSSAAACAEKNIFADPQNLKVLPEDISPERLRATMRGFALGLGARCETCHVGEPGQELSEFDFASDEKETKRTARKMIEMVATINSNYIAKLDGDRVEVDCVRCHRGALKPLLTGEVLEHALADGFPALRAKYLELREDYYGTHSYDFSEGVLVELASRVGFRGELDSAEAILSLNLEYFPDGAQTHFMLGEVALRRDDKAGARRHWERAMELAPNPFLKQRLAELGD